MIGDAEDGPERFHTAIGIAHAGDQKKSPAAHDEQTGEQTREIILRVTQRLPDSPERILEQITAHARARIERGQDEQRLEHDREVIPEIEPASAGDLRKDLRHADGQSRRATRAAKERVLADLFCQIIHLHHGEFEANGLNLRHRGSRITCDVHPQIHSRLESARGDDRHDRHQRFEQHRSITNRPRITLARDDLRRDAAGDERVKTRDRAAGDRDETERKESAGNDQSRSIGEFCHRRHLQIRQHHQHADREREDGA
ncbi:MAG: hypothetical protein JW388_0862 [Nitrospira sp.]|nr:hypothetical protein [Nitrospira sp.]